MSFDQHSGHQTYSAVVTRENEWFIAQCLEIDVASQGSTQDEALANLREALELYLEDPLPSAIPEIRRIEVRTSAA
jgi:predicted RNase H-like HicB family nuclease